MRNVVRTHSTQENRKFWQVVEDVRGWLDWKRAGMNVATHRSSALKTMQARAPNCS
jgi:hypothetical protein